MRNHIPFVKQHEEKDCGAACLSMILQFYGKKIPLAEIAEAVKIDQFGANIYGLLEGGRQFDLIGTALEGTVVELVTGVHNHTIQLPVIARIVNNYSCEHYIVLTSIRGGKVYFCDPGEGQRKLSYNDFSKCFLGQIICFRKASTFKKENRRKGTVMEFIRLIMRQKGLIAVIGLLSAIVTGVSLIGAFLFQYLIDTILPAIRTNQFLNRVAFSEIKAFAVIVLCVGVLYLVKYLMQLLRGKLLTLMSKRINLPLMLGYYDHMIDLKMDFFGNHNTGDIINRFHEAGKVQEALSNVTLALMIDVPMVLFCGITLSRQSPALFAVTISIFILYLLTSVLFIRPLDKKNRQMAIESSKLNSYLKESVDGIQTVKAFGAGPDVKCRTKKLFSNFQESCMKAVRLSMSKDALVEFVASVGVLALLLVGVLNIASGKLTLGVFMTFYSLLGYFLTPIQNTLELQSMMQSAVIAAARLRDILDRSKEGATDIEEKTPFKNGNITFNEVDFRYGNRTLVLKNLSMEIRYGDHVALVGISGCGKTTIAKLLMGFYKPERGEIRIGGKNLSSIDLDELRAHVAYVPQETFLFSDTVRQNLLLGNSNELDDREIMRVLEGCGCDFVKSLPFGLDTMIEENGANLSGGQRQRLAIVRALLREPQILVLDEATSNLDAVSERKLQDALHTMYPNLTVIMVAHRLNSIRDCDQIMVIDNGSLAEIGTHVSLKEKNGIYTALCNGMCI